MGWLILATIIIAIWWAVKSASDKAKIIRDQNSAFLGAREGWDLYVSPYGQTVLGLDPTGAEVVLGTVQLPVTYRTSDVVSVEVLRDGATISSTDRGSQLAGAAIGGLAFGGVGALLGGLSGSKRSRATIQNIGLKIIVDDRVAPVHLIDFFRSPKRDGIDAKSPLLRPALAAVDRNHALLVAALRKVSATGAMPVPLTSSTTQEIERLWNLKQAGAITEDEFLSHKTRLLSAVPTGG